MKMSISAFICVILVGVFSLAGCQNTVEGVGKDMESNGKAIQKSA